MLCAFRGDRYREERERNELPLTYVRMILETKRKLKKEEKK
jgi:hypothetical protein